MGYITITKQTIYKVNNYVLNLVRIPNIDERKSIEIELKEREERYRTVIEIAEEGVWEIDADNITTFVNQIMANMLGYTTAEMLGVSLFHFMDQEGVAITQRNLESRRQGIRGKHEFKYLHKNGSALWTLVSAGPIFDTRGNYAGSIAMVTDITNQKEIERLKDEFISIVSHEIRTPLTAIQGSLGILVAGVYSNRPEKVQKMLHLATSNCERLHKLVNDILDLERLDAGKFNLEMAPCQVTTIVEQAIESIEPLVQKAEITIECQVIGAEITADYSAIVQVLINLISNAIKFSPPQSVITIGTQIRNLGSSPCILFWVADQGRGIPSSKLGTIFERFQQVDPSDVRDKGGSGLGLAICKKIVENHGGQIWAESVLGQGSTFYFTIPIDPSP